MFGRDTEHTVSIHEHLSEDWLIDNLPHGWSYDCVMGDGQSGFIITAPGVAPEDGLFIPIRLLK